MRPVSEALLQRGWSESIFTSGNRVGAPYGSPHGFPPVCFGDLFYPMEHKKLPKSLSSKEEVLLLKNVCGLDFKDCTIFTEDRDAWPQQASKARLRKTRHPGSSESNPRNSKKGISRDDSKGSPRKDSWSTGAWRMLPDRWRMDLSGDIIRRGEKE